MGWPMMQKLIQKMKLPTWSLLHLALQVLGQVQHGHLRRTAARQRARSAAQRCKMRACLQLICMRCAPLPQAQEQVVDARHMKPQNWLPDRNITFETN